MSGETTDETDQGPASYQGVMVSSTFDDLEDHRKELMRVLRREKLVALSMEDYVVDPDDDVISSSLSMVRDAAAYIGLIGRRYGGIPKDSKHNRNGWSITRLEFEDAQKRKRPTVIFIMGDKHPVIEDHIEFDPAKRKKLEIFRRRAKKGRIYIEFQSFEEFKREVPHAIANLRRILDANATASPSHPPEPDPFATEENHIPKPPEFHAEPPYLGSHEFVGRRAELETLDDWALPSDSHPMLLFEAIGGTGKSMLTWHWINHHAEDLREGDDAWAGRFWYSFYERGARLESFCRHALAYMTGQPLDRFDKTKMPELSEQLLAELKARPWLIVFDGLERILVTYNRSDAAELSDEAAENPKDKIADRDPLAAIRPEDDELLKALSAPSKSKLLISSRLIPRALMNQANQAIPGVLHERLSGLRPADAEALLRSCKIEGDSDRIRNYLQEHCGCHPLVIGVLAGLINRPGPWRGDFDAWEKAPDGGGKLNLADLDLIQKRNHILESALAILPEKNRALLSTLALLSEGADAVLLLTFNPHAEEACAEHQLWDTAKDLEDRGFLQYDRNQKHYDLHPVVRGIVVGGLRPEETETYGERVVDHFSARPHDPWDEAESLEDVHDGILVVRTLLRMGRHQAACNAYRGNLADALLFNLEAHSEVLALLEDFFPEGWDRLPEGLDWGDGSYLANSAAGVLFRIGQYDASLAALGASLRDELETGNWTELRTRLSNIAVILKGQNRFAPSHRLRRLALELAEQHDSVEALFMARLFLFSGLTIFGTCAAAEALWEEMDSMGRHWSRAVYRPGHAEFWHAEFCFRRRELTEGILTEAERLASKGKDRVTLRGLHALRAEWRLQQDEPDLAAKSYEEALRMARESGLNLDALRYETWLALARVRAGHLSEKAAQREAERLSADGGANRPLALLWAELGDDHKCREAAKRHALAAYKWAWGDGEPYVQRYELEQTKVILDQLGEPYPDLPPYDPEKDPKFDWEADVEAAIAKLKAEREGKEAAEKEDGKDSE